MYTKFEFTSQEPFLLTEAELRSLSDNTLADENVHISIHASCNDDAMRTFDSLDELLAYGNDQDKRILSLLISQQRLDRTDTLEREPAEYRLEFTVKPNQQSASISIMTEGEEDEAFLAKEKLTRLVTRIRPWFHRIANADQGIVPATLLLLLAFALLSTGSIFLDVIGAVDAGTAEMTDAAPSDAALLFVMLVIAVAAVIVYALLLKCLISFRRWAFPSGMFLIGQQIKRHNRLKAVRQWAVATVSGIALINVAVFAGVILPW